MADAAAAPAPGGGKKKLIIIIAAVLVLVLGGGVAVLMMMKSKAAAAAAAAEEEDGGGPKKKAAAKADPNAMPVFVPLDPFTVNLADRNAERYAQVGITLQIDDPKLADTIKAYMPAIRNNVLMAIADRTANELLEREGKAKLAEKVRRETSRAMGYDVPEPEPEAEEEEEPAAKPKKKKRPPPEPELPIRAVHFSNFIIQ